MALPDGAASIWVKATRIADLTATGAIAPGSPTYTTVAAVKATITPVLETGDDIAIKNASGGLSAWGKHGDMIKYYTVSLELAVPDPGLIQAMAGGTLLAASGAALGAPTGLTATVEEKGEAVAKAGKLAISTLYGYKVTQVNQYGESVASTLVTATTGAGTATEQVVVLSGVTAAAGATAVRIYGRTSGYEQFIGSYLLIGATQKTNAASGTGAVTSLTVSALTAPIPLGTRFTLAGDTNTEKIVFTTTAFAPIGSTTLAVKTLQATIGTTIATAANIQQVFVDNGTVVPNGYYPSTDTTAGPGEAVGYQAPALGNVANEEGVSLEFFEEAIVGGYQASQLPYFRHVLPRVTNMHVMPKDLTNANTATIIEGQAFQNPNWGSGPLLDWQFDSSKVYQYARCSSQIVPEVGFASTPAL